MPKYMPDAKYVTWDGPAVEWSETRGIRVISVTKRVGPLATTLSMSVEEAAALIDDLQKAIRSQEPTPEYVPWPGTEPKI